jgi:hypothetical protein
VVKICHSIRVHPRVSVAILALALAACSDRPDYSRPAVQSPYSLADPNSEVLGTPTHSVPLLTLDLPNKKNEDPTLHTIADNLPSLTSRPASTQATLPEPSPVPNPGVPSPGIPPTQPTSAPASQPAAASEPASVKVVAQQRPNDQFRITRDAEGKLDLWILCPTGIGTVTLERTADSWPALIRVHLRYDATREFSRLEGFTASELTAAGIGGAGGGKVALRTVIDLDTATAQVAIPGFSRSPRIQIEWVDMYR